VSPRTNFPSIVSDRKSPRSSEKSLTSAVALNVCNPSTGGAVSASAAALPRMNRPAPNRMGLAIDYAFGRNVFDDLFHAVAAGWMIARDGDARFEHRVWRNDTPGQDDHLNTERGPGADPTAKFFEPRFNLSRAFAHRDLLAIEAMVRCPHLS